jgi:hypothetical protein
MVRNFRRSGQEPALSLMSQGENAYLVLSGSCCTASWPSRAIDRVGAVGFWTGVDSRSPEQMLADLKSRRKPLVREDERSLTVAPTGVEFRGRCGFEGIRCH